MICLCLVLAGFYWGAGRSLDSSKPQTATQSLSSLTELEPPKVPEEFPLVIQKNSTLSSTLRPLGFSGLDIHNIVAAAKPHYNLNYIRPGVRFRLLHDLTPLTKPSAVRFELSPEKVLSLTSNGNQWFSELEQKPVEIQLTHFFGDVESTLWQSAEEAKMDFQLIAELSEIFAWQVDFAREVRQGDRWRLTVEQKFVDDRFVGWGRIVAAEYQNRQEHYKAVLFRHEGRDLGYFAPDGSSLRRMFLKSPIRFARISSRFQRRRFHPILKINRPHLGVDYAAPTGTPVRTVGDGEIVYIAYNRGGGNTIKIRHNSTYRTHYLHLSRFANGMRRGKRVQQGQVIGYVGSTGMSTGPHLHFEFYQNGRFIDPLGRQFPAADPVPKPLLETFQISALPQLDTLPDWELEPQRSISSLDEQIQLDLGWESKDLLSTTY